MKSAVHPVPLILFLSVIALILTFQVYGYQGAFLFLAATVVLAAAIGWLIGRRWRMYPWQIGLLGAVPSFLFILWRFYTQEPHSKEAQDNINLFVFQPLLVVIAGHFGGLVGRWQALKSRSAGSGGK